MHVVIYEYKIKDASPFDQLAEYQWAVCALKSNIHSIIITSLFKLNMLCLR